MDALLYVPVAIAISLTPGPNNFCGLNNGIRAGVGPAMNATEGLAAAFAIFLTVSAVGLGAMLLASEAAFTAVKWVGAAYLFWLGWKAWHSREFSGLALEDAPGSGQASGQPVQFHLRALIAQEFLLGITNPKAPVSGAGLHLSGQRIRLDGRLRQLRAPDPPLHPHLARCGPPEQGNRRFLHGCWRPSVGHQPLIAAPWRG